MTAATAAKSRSVVLHVGGLHYATEKEVVERVLGARPVAQTATVEYVPQVTTIEALREWVEECGFDCAGPLGPRPRARACSPSRSRISSVGTVPLNPSQGGSDPKLFSRWRAPGVGG
jgi:Cu2+-exporting ATPase